MSKIADLHELLINVLYSVMKNKSLLIMAIFYVLAGINHFINPQAYYTIIPAYFSNPHFINIAAGISEIIAGILLFIPQTRRIACYGIIAMLIAFIPAHIYMLKIGWCIKDLFCLPLWAIWVRLIILQPLLIWWAYTNRK